ncbi:MAG: hypothetical protein HY355_03925 [Armatimonadetes bacterium]|nr:hypothetical protein [Armatimonadota bacterium]
MGKATSRRPRLPGFRTDEDERTFWETHRPGDHLDAMQPARVQISRQFRQRVKERKKNVTFRMQPSQIEAIKKVARELGVGYQTLMRMWILEGLRRKKAG